MRRPPAYFAMGAAAVLCLLATLDFFVLTDDPAPEATPASLSTAAPAPAAIERDEFGVRAASFETIENRIQRNETFSDLLGSYNVPFPKIVEIAERAKPLFDVRYLRAGKPYRLYHADDSLQTAQLFVYQRDPINYVVFDLRDSVQVYEGQRPVQVVEREVEGVITSSLYETLVDQDVDPALATELSEVFAWQVDFYRIQKGDRFKAVFEEKLVDGEPVGLGAIRAARLNHFGSDYLAFAFEQENGFVDYFDAEGNSLRKAFLVAPVKYSRISSRYTLRRYHPVQKRYKAHLGTDYAAAHGTPIRATGDGVVLEAQYKRYNGNYVKIRHNGTYTTGYLHMSRIAPGMKPGTRVQQGDVIGYVGSTGLATGPHVCYRFWKNGRQVDPLKEEFPSSHPVEETDRPAFEERLQQYMPRLQDADDIRIAALHNIGAPIVAAAL